MNEQNQKIIELLSQGKTQKEVASEIGMNINTLEKRIASMRKQHGCDNVTQLIFKLLKQIK